MHLKDKRNKELSQKLFKQKEQQLALQEYLKIDYYYALFFIGTLLLFITFYECLRSDYENDLSKSYSEIVNTSTQLLKKFNEELEIRQTEVKCNVISDVLKFDCHPENGASELSCQDRGCCWKPLQKQKSNNQTPLNIPYCYYPNGWSMYEVYNVSEKENEIYQFLKQKSHSFYKNDIPLVKMEALGIDQSTLRVKIYDPQIKRYEPPWPIRPKIKPSKKRMQQKQYNFKVDYFLPGFSISRTSTNVTLFNSIGIGGFIFANQFLQISSTLPTSNIYGLGEHRTKLKLNTHWQSFTLFNKDQPPTENANLYGSHPFYFIIEDSGNCHGVLFLNSNAMDVILQPSPAITFRSIGGIFDIYFFMGPTPADVLKQYSEIVGKPFLPPYWSLGFHLCRFGYGSLEKTKEVWKRTKDAQIPFDTQWNDLDYMDKNNDFTYNKKTFKDLPQFIEDIHSAGMHYIPLIDAGISNGEKNSTYLPYDEGIREKIFVTDEFGNPFVGKVWNLISTVWPDFTNPKTPEYYRRMMKEMHDNFAFDGAWIDMNEPSNFYNGHKNGCSQNNLDYPPYMPNVVGNLLSLKTLCMNAKLNLGKHYDLHNLYGMSQAIATNYALTHIRQKRPFIISRSTWEGHGFYAGHWTGDIYSSWHDLKMSIPEVLAFSFFQIPMVGADICGFDGNTTVSLCNRWMQLGAFYPFSRNHNSDSTIEQDPVAMGELVVLSSKKALNIRYRLLPYLYTLFYRAHKFGETVARPLFFEFPFDLQTYDVDTHFLWGPSFMIIPVLEEDKLDVSAYIPRGLWYDYYTRNSFFSIGKNFTFEAPLDTIPLLIRGGFILPAQKPGLTTVESRKNDFELIVALNQFSEANGEMYWDDGDSLDAIENKKYIWVEFTTKNQTLTSKNIEKTTFKDDAILGNIEILGIKRKVSRVSLNDNDIGFQYENSILKVEGLILNLKKDFYLKWQYESDKKK
ncbi:lysosomal alpha-glucosidase-like [Prorops nasuta]|uniref:lysosomal alpha-glucosidase-like n=1 Tax=Prorops nasuta TaxID=863751 RepID=UPI0034CFE3DF